MNPLEIGVNRGTTLLQRSGSIGGARYVFYKLKGIKNQLVYPIFGGLIKNPFSQVPAKMFAGDLLEFRLDKDGVNPEVYILKTFEVAKASSEKKVLIKRNGYRHRPCVGDKIGVAPDQIGGAITTPSTVTAVKETNTGSEGDVWELTLAAAATFTKGDILVEADSSNKMLIKEVNAFADSDVDFCYVPSTGDDDFDGARYMYTPAIGGAMMFISRMSKMPKCVLDRNVSRFNGLYQLPSIG